MSDNLIIQERRHIVSPRKDGDGMEEQVVWVDRHDLLKAIEPKCTSLGACQTHRLRTVDDIARTLKPHLERNHIHGEFRVLSVNRHLILKSQKVDTPTTKVTIQ